MENSLKLKLNFNTLIWAFWALFIMFPWHSTANNLLKWITIAGNITLLTIIALMISVFLLLYTVKDGVSIKKGNILVLLYFTLVLGAFGRGDALIKTKILDGGNILFQLIIYWGLQNRRTKKKTLREFLALTVKMMNINYCINVLFYLTRNFALWGINSSDHARFGGGYFALGIVTGAIALYSLCTKDKILKKNEAYITLVFALFGFIVSAIRTNLIVFLGVSCIIIFFSSERAIYKSSVMTKIIVVCFGVLAIVFFLNGNSYIVERLSSMGSLRIDGNLRIRISTMEYYLKFIKEHPLGAGFGYLVHFVHWNETFLENQLSIDNSFLYCAIKCGIPTVIILFYIVVIKPILNIIKSSNTKSFKVCMISIWLGYIFATGMMTNQIFYSITNLAFIWAMLSVLSLEKENVTGRMRYNE